LAEKEFSRRRGASDSQLQRERLFQSIPSVRATASTLDSCTNTFMAPMSRLAFAAEISQVRSRPLALEALKLLGTQNTATNSSVGEDLSQTLSSCALV
jgi:hypothetical protein